MLTPSKKSYNQPRQHIKKQRYNFPNKFHLDKSIVFPAVMSWCESWTIKKVECWRIDAFELWCWRRLLQVPWTARRSNQSILKEINSEYSDYSLEGVMLKLKLQYFGLLTGKDPDAGKDWRQEEGTTEDKMFGWHHQLSKVVSHHWLYGDEFEQLWEWWWTGKPGIMKSMESQRVGHDWATELTDLVQTLLLFIKFKLCFLLSHV